MKCKNPKCKAENEAGAHFCHMCGTKLGEGVSPNLHVSEIDRNILAVIKENSYSNRVLAAYEGRQYANNIAKTSFGRAKKNYKEYVEMLMKQNYPQELEKSILGKKFLIWLWITVLLSLLTAFGIILAIPIIIWIVVPTYKKLKSMCA